MNLSSATDDSVWKFLTVAGLSDTIPFQVMEQSARRGSDRQSEATHVARGARSFSDGNHERSVPSPLFRRNEPARSVAASGCCRNRRTSPLYNLKRYRGS